MVTAQRAGREPATIRAQLAKIARLRDVGAAEIDLSGLNPNRVRHLAGLGRRMDPQAIARLEDRRRSQILAATVVELHTERIDEVFDLFDLAIAGIEHNARVEQLRTLCASPDQNLAIST